MNSRRISLMDLLLILFGTGLAYWLIPAVTEFP